MILGVAAKANKLFAPTIFITLIWNNHVLPFGKIIKQLTEKGSSIFFGNFFNCSEWIALKQSTAEKDICNVENIFLPQ